MDERPISSLLNRSGIFVGLAACVVILLLLNRVWEPALRLTCGVQRDVHFLGEDIGGLLGAEVVRLVDQQAYHYWYAGQDAVYDVQNDTVVPEVNGFYISRAETVRAIMQARRGEDVQPVCVMTVPTLCASDYPEALIMRGSEAKKQLGLIVVVEGAEIDTDIGVLLRVLEEHGAGATFFLAGQWAGQNRLTARMIAAAGHELGIYGYHGQPLAGLPPLQVEAELNRSGVILTAIAGERPGYFLPPGGGYDRLLLEVASRCGLRTVYSTMDVAQLPAPAGTPESEVSAGSIILCRPDAQAIGLLEQQLPLWQNDFAVSALRDLLSPSPFDRKGELLVDLYP